MASAVFSGSSSAGSAGRRDVFTLQNRHPRVHVSPSTMIVAVAAPFLLDQHSPILGQRASSQTVAVRLAVENDEDPRQHGVGRKAQHGEQVGVRLRVVLRVRRDYDAVLLHAFGPDARASTRRALCPRPRGDFGKFVATAPLTLGARTPQGVARPRNRTI